MSQAILDAAQRARALDYQQSFCVQAPAGSGKTELLTQRILKLLAHCERPEDILAFTFTRKAAAEMRKRLLDALEAAEALCGKDGNPDPEQLATLAPHKRLTLDLGLAVLQQDRLLGWNLLQNSQRLRINTIDSFTAWLTARLPLGAGFGARPGISTDMQAVFEEAVRLTLDSLESNDSSADQVASLLRHQHGNLRKAETLLMQLLEKRDQWLPLLGSLGAGSDRVRAVLEDNLDTLLSELIDAAVVRLVPFEGEIMQLVQFAANQSANKQAAALQACNFSLQFPPATTAAAEPWQQLGKFFLTADAKGFRKRVDINHGFPAESHAVGKDEKQRFKDMKALFLATAGKLAEAGLLPLLQRLAQMPPPGYSEQQWSVLADVVALLPLLAARLRTVMMAHGLIDHTESALAALQALGDELEPTDLALQLDYRIQHILVDEFQDTSSMQFRLLELLTAGWSEGDGRTLFIVGDGMQSCYGFRNANVGLFLRAREQVANVKMELLQLQVNFRSAPQVVDWVNAIFAGAFPAEDDIARGGVSYSASVARPAAKTGAGVHAFLFHEPAADQADTASGARPPCADARQHEASEVAGLCSRLLADHPDDSIAILVRNRGVLAAIVPALRRAGLRWNAEAIDPLLSYAPINDLFTLLRALLNLADSTAWYALLRCPFVGLTLADLEVLALQRRQQGRTLYSTLLTHADIVGLSDDARLRLQRVVPLLTAARQRWQSLPLAELLEQLWLELGGAACLDDNSMLDNIDDFLRQVEAASQHGDIRDIHQFETRLRRCHGSAREPGVRLHIMTMHKAKGLEFDHVILPGLERRPRHDDSALLLWQEYIARDNHARNLLALIGSKGTVSDPLHDYLKRESVLRNRLESTRLLYIAVTRAIKSAWLFGKVKQTKDSFTAASSSLLQGILPQLLDDTLAHQARLCVLPEAGSTTPASAATATALFRRLPAQWCSPGASELLAAAPLAQAPEPTHDVLAAMIGELVHVSLQTWVQQRQAGAAAPAATPALWRSRLRPLCCSAQQLDAALLRVATQIEACLSDSASAWLFQHLHSEDACELGLTDYSSGLRLDYSIDRTFVDAAGIRWIIDYKSALPQAGQTLDAFLQEQEARYRPQLTTYARLLRILDARPQRCALYFTALPYLHLVAMEP